ncbi:uncharacterized protein FFMR_12535 [Fusarium fujikuroi]|nr:uncharacterized protein FFMR_12535 [Fusarium fujikuroi]
MSVSPVASSHRLFVPSLYFIAADTMRPGLYSCEPCLRKAMDWYPSDSDPIMIPKICIDEEGFNREDFHCNVCDGDMEKEHGACEGGTQRMGSLLKRYIKHIKANRRVTKEAYVSNPKTIRLFRKASRAIASYSNRTAADSTKDHHDEHKCADATETLSCLIDIKNSLRIIAQCALHISGLEAGIPDEPEMPARCDADMTLVERLGDFNLDELEDEEN